MSGAPLGSQSDRTSAQSSNFVTGLDLSATPTNGGPDAAVRPIALEDVQPPNLGVGLNRTIRPQARKRGWGGINQGYSFDARLESQSPDLQNMEGYTRYGALRTRRGIVKIDSGTPAAEGLCVCPLNIQTTDGKRHVAVVSYDGSTNSTIEAVALETDVKRAEPISAIPAITLDSPVAGQFRSTAATTGMPGEVERLLIRWSEAGFPLAYTEQPDLRSENQPTVSGVHAAWNAYSSLQISLPVTPDTSLNGKTLYVTVWAVSRLGVSKPFFGRVVVSS